MQSRKRNIILAIAPFLLVCIFFEIAPILFTIYKSFIDDTTGIVTFNNFKMLFSISIYKDAIVNSIFISIISAIIGLFIAYFVIKSCYRNNSKISKFFINILNMVSNFSGVPLAFSFIIMFGNIGVLTLLGNKMGIEWLSNFKLYSINGLLIIYIYFQIPLACLLLLPSMKILKKEWQDACFMMGGKNKDFWLKIGLPNLFPSLISSFSILFANALAAYASAYALMMNNIPLLPIRLSEQFSGDVVQHPGIGSAIAVVMIILMTISILIQNFIIGGKNEKKTAK